MLLAFYPGTMAWSTSITMGFKLRKACWKYQRFANWYFLKNQLLTLTFLLCLNFFLWIFVLDIDFETEVDEVDYITATLNSTDPIKVLEFSCNPNITNAKIYSNGMLNEML